MRYHGDVHSYTFSVLGLSSLFRFSEHYLTASVIEDLRQKIREWICPFDVEVSHRKARSVCQAGTGSWFIDGPFQRWFRGQEESRLLYLEGKCKLWILDAH